MGACVILPSLFPDSFKPTTAKENTMLKSLKANYVKLLQQHEATLAAAEKRGNDSDAAARHLRETLGESERRRLLAHIGLRSLEPPVSG